MVLYGRVRYAVQIDGLSRRAAARQFGIDLRTVAQEARFGTAPLTGAAVTVTREIQIRGLRERGRRDELQ